MTGGTIRVTVRRKGRHGSCRPEGPGGITVRSRLFAAAACLSLAMPLVTALPSPAAATDGSTPVATPLRSLGQGQSPPLRSAPAHPVAAGRTGTFPYRPVPHRQVPGALTTDPASVQSTASPATGAPVSGTGFAGNGNDDLVLPPDTNADIGYDAQGNAWMVQWVNLHYQMWERLSGQTSWSSKVAASGNTVFASLNNLCSSTNDGDPSVVYDRMAHRWVLTQFAFDTDFFFGMPTPPYGECVAVSQTADPSGAYNLYSWDVGSWNGTDYFPDYPKLGVWPNGYYLTFNYFSGNNLSTFNGAGLVVLDRTAMLAGQAAQANGTGPLGASIASLLPVTVDDSTSPGSTTPETLTAVDTNSTAGGSALQWWHVSDVGWGSSLHATLTRLADTAVATYSWNLCNQSRNCLPQPGTKVGLDPVSDRLMYRAGYRTVGGTGHVVLNHTAAVGTQAALRWYDVVNVTSTPSVAQYGTYAPSSDNRWLGSAAMDAAGDLAVGYSVASSSTYPSLRYAGRAPGDAAGTLGPEVVLKQGAGSQTSSSNRWGDYSSLVVDPLDGCTFWYTNEYYTATASYSWSTWIGSFTFPGCGSSPAQPPAAPTGLTATATSGTSDQVDLSWTGSTGATGYDVYRGGTKVTATPISGTTYHDSGLAPSTTYSYTVTARNTSGESGPSNTATVTTNAPAATPPGAFTLTATAASATSIRLSWTASAGASSYSVFRRSGNKGSYGLDSSCATTSATSCTDGGLAAGTQYWYYVVARNTAGLTTQSNTVNARTPRR